jgi:tetratricopeptide (TPR) repeat protein
MKKMPKRSGKAAPPPQKAEKPHGRHHIALFDLPPDPAETPGWGKAVVAALLLATFLMAIKPIRSPDVWHHIACGRLVAQTHGPARADVFSCTAKGKPWIQYEWLAQFIIYAVHAATGANGLVLFRALIIAAAAGLLTAAARLKRGSSWTATAIVVSLAMMAASLRFFTRPEIFTFLLFSATRLAGEHIRQGRRNYIIVPALLMVPWVNMHGAWPAGLAWMGLAAAGETAELLIRPRRAWGARAVKDLWIALALATAATFVNPYGYMIWHVPFALSSMPEVTKYIHEWQPPNWDHWSDPRHIGAFVFLAVVLLSLRTPTIADWLVLLFFGYLAFKAKRHLAICMIAVAPAIAPQIRAIGAKWLGAAAGLRRQLRLRYAVAVLVILVCVPISLGGLDYKLFGLGVRYLNVPKGAADFLEKHSIDGNLFNTYIFGNYLMFARYPANHVFIDGRVDMYGSRIIQKYNEIRQAEAGWERALAGYDIDCCVLSTEEGTDNELIEALKQHPRWALVYWDDNSAVYLHRDGKYSELIAGLYVYVVRPDDLDTEMLQTREGFDQAVADYMHKLEEDPQCTRAMYDLAGCLDARGKAAESLDLLRTAVDIRPEIPTLHYALGTMLYRVGQLEEARRELQTALDYGASAQQTLVAMSAVYRDLGKREKAVKCARKAVELDPNHWGAQWNFSVLAEENGDLPAAFQAARNALQIRPGDPATQERVEQLARRMGARR